MKLTFLKAKYSLRAIQITFWRKVWRIRLEVVLKTFFIKSLRKTTSFRDNLQRWLWIFILAFTNLFEGLVAELAPRVLLGGYLNGDFWRQLSKVFFSNLIDDVIALDCLANCVLQWSSKCSSHITSKGHRWRLMFEDNLQTRNSKGKFAKIDLYFWRVRRTVMPNLSKVKTVFRDQKPNLCLLRVVTCYDCRFKASQPLLSSFDQGLANRNSLGMRKNYNLNKQNKDQEAMWSSIGPVRLQNLTTRASCLKGPSEMIQSFLDEMSHFTETMASILEA